MERILFIFLFLTFTGCVSTRSGLVIDTEAIQSLKLGITTEEDVIAKFDSPVAIKTSSNGNKTLICSYSEAQSQGVVGFGSYISIDAVTTEFVFGKDGKLFLYEITRAKYQ